MRLSPTERQAITQTIRAADPDAAVAALAPELLAIVPKAQAYASELIQHDSTKPANR